MNTNGRTILEMVKVYVQKIKAFNKYRKMLLTFLKLTHEYTLKQFNQTHMAL